jgi:hypothetical protein
MIGDKVVQDDVINNTLFASILDYSITAHLSERLYGEEVNRKGK